MLNPSPFGTPFRGRGGPRGGFGFPWGGYMRGGPMQMPYPPHPTHISFFGIPEDKVAQLITEQGGK